MRISRSNRKRSIQRERASDTFRHLRQNTSNLLQSRFRALERRSATNLNDEPFARHARSTRTEQPFLFFFLPVFNLYTRRKNKANGEEHKQKSQSLMVFLSLSTIQGEEDTKTDHWREM
ncbi:hypothetical protein CEXT_501981 [Caerostris extrusa]|uniref:Uncharacterized protein n=1 Tax=Caerostris extrusa TaxID=172846 RepID=A0AAV4MVH6_CAEEX|nr:hypothetical protein CEXT_501981 [Caerostris extrusa]